MTCPICLNKFMERQPSPLRDYCPICGYSHWPNQPHSADHRMVAKAKTHKHEPLSVDPATGYKICKNGHLRSPDNVYSNGTCKQCQQARDRSGSRQATARTGA